MKPEIKTLKKTCTSLLVFFLLTSIVEAQQQDTLLIVAFGNSTTAERKNIDKVYPTRLAETLVTRGIPVRVVNAGIPGSHSGSVNDNNFHNLRHGRDRFESAVLDRRPDWVIICFGINDSWQDSGKNTPSRIPVKQYRANISYYIDQIRKQDGRVILMTPNPLGKKYETWRHQKLKEYAEAVRSIARRKNAALVDTWALFSERTQARSEETDALLLDGMHPNDSGHTLMADELAQIITRTLKKHETQ